MSICACLYLIEVKTAVLILCNHEVKIITSILPSKGVMASLLSPIVEAFFFFFFFGGGVVVVVVVVVLFFFPDFFTACIFAAFLEVCASANVIAYQRGVLTLMASMYNFNKSTGKPF